MEYTEYSKTRYLQNILYLIWTGLTGKQSQRILGCFEILKIQFSYCCKPHYRPYDGFESHLAGWRVLHHVACSRHSDSRAREKNSRTTTKKKQGETRPPRLTPLPLVFPVYNLARSSNIWTPGTGYVSRESNVGMLNGNGKLSSVSTTNVCRRDGDVLLRTYTL